MISLIYISRLKFRGFKSFRHADIPLSKGFVCLAGPNGSGKSNVTDAIRFAFGEMSLKALRAKKVAELINNSCSKAEVIVEIDGDRKYEIRRAIREDGKTIYRLDGRRTTRTGVMEALRVYGYDGGGHNVIAQGQVQKIIEMNSKERRGIIDTVAGIAEFEDKKDEALRELDKVEQKITEANTVLNERSGFLSGLEKEKDDALQYIEASTLHKRGRASLVHYELERLNKSFTDIVSRQVAFKEEAARLTKDIAILDQRIGELEQKKSAITSKINARTEQNETYQALQSLDITISTDRNSVSDKGRETERLKAKLKSLDEEKKSLLAKKEAVVREAADLKKQASSLAKEIDRFEKEHKSQLKQSKAKSLAEFKQKIESLGSELEKKREERARLQSEMSRLAEISRMKREELGRMKMPAEDSNRAEKLSAELSVMNSEIEVLAREIDSLFTDEKRLNKELPEYDRRLLEMKEKIAVLRMSASPSAASLALRTVSELKESNAIKGIYGTVADLIKFDSEYAVAIEASAGQRLSYVLVESLEVASKVIERLKSQKAGRCTFIPIDTVISSRSSETAKLQNATGSMGLLLDYVDFDKRFYSAMEYVFGDTLLVTSVESAKKMGVGKARMVTKEGELLERSGIITGGSLKASLASRSQLDRMEKELEDLKRVRGSAYEEMASLRDRMSNKRKERAEREVKLKSVEIELSTLTGTSGRAKDAAELAQKLASEAEQAARGASESEKLLSKTSSEIGNMEQERENAKASLAGEEERQSEEMGELEKQLGELVSRRSSLEADSKAKESEKSLFDQRISSLDSDHKSVAGDIQNLRDELKSLEERIASNSKLRAAKDEKLKDMSSSMEKHMKQLEALNGEQAEMQKQRGSLKYEEEKKAREVGELEVKRATSEQRLVDLKAAFEELKGVPLIDANKGELEEMIRKSDATMASIPNPNLQAPQKYEEMKKDIDEVKVRVGKLVEEKSAVMGMIGEIDTKKRTIFMETFNTVNDNFRKIFNYVFKGEGLLLLDQPSDPLSSGLMIKVRDEKQKESYLDSLSGGEKSLLALLFIFAIQLYKPAPFYILDEADAALDKENSKKLAGLLRELSGRTQLIVVTHNDSVLSAAEVALGVARTPEGSKIVGIQLEKQVASVSPQAPKPSPQASPSGK